MATDNNNKVLNVPNLRFPEFTEEWELHRTTDYFEFKNGLNPEAKRFGYGTKFISVMDILNNRYITYDKVISSVQLKENELNEFGVNYGDMLFQRSSETLEDVGRANVYLDNTTAVFGGFVIRGKKIGNYNPLFFRYLLSSPNARKSIIVKGAGAQHFNISQDGLSKVLLNVPSIQEQEKISQLINYIDERIETQNKIIEQLQSLIKGIYDKIFADFSEYHTLSSICKIQKGQQINGEELSESGDYYVMNGGIEPSGFYDKYNTMPDTISISEGGNSCGYIQFNTVPFWSGGHCYTLQGINTEYNTHFVYHYLKSQEKEIMALRIGSGLPNIQKKDLEKFPVPVLPLETQIRISDGINKIETKLKQEKNMLSTYQTQKAYLLKNLFI